jgi:hypothetical protein
MNKTKETGTKNLDREQKPFIHPLVLVIGFLFLLIVIAVVGLHTSLKEKTRPKENVNRTATPPPNVSQ